MTLPSRERCYQALKETGSVGEAALSLGISRHQFRRITKGINAKQTFSSELYRNRGTTQIPISSGPVVKAPSNFDLFLSSDWHAGQESCDYDSLRAMIGRIGSTRNARAIFGGDQMEVTPPGHHDGGRNSDSYIDGQIIRTAKGLEPIKHKIDLIYRGNHGSARLDHVGIDPDLLLSSSLKVNYSTVPTVLQYVTPDGTIKLCGGHGRGVTANSMTELRKLRMIYPNCHLYHLGHDHSLFGEPGGAMEYDAEGNEFWSPVWMCRTGSFLRYADYARYGLYEPKPTGYLIAHIRKGKIESVEVVKA